MPARILIIEDDPLFAMLLREILTDNGYEVVGVAANAGKAVQQAAIEGPDLLLSDIQLQGPGDGIEAAIEIRKRREIAVVFLTAANDPQTIERAKAARPAAYLNKPADLSLVVDAVEHALEDQRETK